MAANKLLVVETVYRQRLTSIILETTSTVNALSSVNDTAWLNSGLVALAWRTLLANQWLVDVRNYTYNTADIYALIHINTHQNILWTVGIFKERKLSDFFCGFTPVT